MFFSELCPRLFLLWGIQQLNVYFEKFKQVRDQQDHFQTTVRFVSSLSSILVGAVQTAGMTELLNQQGALTFFAPTNQAFAALPKADLVNLMGEFKMDRVTS